MPKDDNYFFQRRKAMVEQQLAGKGIRDQRVLSVMLEIPREKFVLKRDLNDAYADSPLGIDCNQTISQPYMVALMTECLNLMGDEKVLEIGTGSGYQTAILARLCKEVYSIERHSLLAEQAQARLKEMGFENVKIMVGDGTCGWKEYAPYEGIIVTAGAPDATPPLVEQLAIGGRLVIPIGDIYTQILKIIIKQKKGYIDKSVCGCKFVPLVGEYGWQE